jgi:hypothetical protein
MPGRPPSSGARPSGITLKDQQMKTSRWHRAAIAVLALTVLTAGSMGAAQAGIVSTGAIVQTERGANLATIRSQLDRAEVRVQMEKLGVDAAAVDKRIASLSDREISQMATQLQSAPAGGDVLVIIGLVFVVLMILEFTGIIDIFKRA